MLLVIRGDEQGLGVKINRIVLQTLTFTYIMVSPFKHIGQFNDLEAVLSSFLSTRKCSETMSTASFIETVLKFDFHRIRKFDIAIESDVIHIFLSMASE